MSRANCQGKFARNNAQRVVLVTQLHSARRKRQGSHARNKNARIIASAPVATTIVKSSADSTWKEISYVGFFRETTHRPLPRLRAIIASMFVTNIR